MAKKFDYFKAFETQAEFGLQAADFLKKTLCSYNRHSLMLALESMHTIEGKADAVNHEIREHLRLDFVTPVEREDISQLSQCLDDVVIPSKMCLWVFICTTFLKSTMKCSR